MEQEQYTFKAEITELMNMIIHNFYSNSDIFLRELISNASDAINKVKFNSLADSSILRENYDFEIKIKLNKDEKTITIEDSGVGMSKDDLINNLGTIAKSGTKEFIKKMTQTDSESSKNLIGQFGVGFYSAYLIADNVKVITRLAGTDDVFEWKSSANGSFTLQQITDDSIQRGTRITMYVKPDAEEYLDESKIIEIIKKHSSYITYPIMLQKFVTREEEVEASEPKGISSELRSGGFRRDWSDRHLPNPGEYESKECESKECETKCCEASECDCTDSCDTKKTTKSDVTIVEDVDDDDDDTKEVAKPTRTVTEEKWEKINSETIWAKSPSDITEEEYFEFYKSISGDYEKHLALKHFKIEGNLELTGLLYVPAKAPFDLFDNKSKKNGIKLYVKKVLITEKCQDLYPEWMSFAKGVVDSQDLPLNASRELLQHNKILKQISKHLVKKTIDMLTDLSEDAEKFKTFYENFDKSIKLGVHEETDGNREKLTELLRYNTSAGEMVSFKQYTERMKEGQPGIYFITGDSIKTLENSPFVDKLKKMDYEIIYMVDPIDEYIIQHLSKYKETKLINVSKDDLSLPDQPTDDNKYEELCSKIKSLLGDKIDSVIVSKKIESQPAIVTNPMGMSANMERIMKAQALASKNSNPMYQMMMSRKNLEINPDHPLMKKINSKIMVEPVTTTDAGFCEETNKVVEVSEVDNETSNLVNIVYESALLSGGYQVSDINNYLKKVYSYIN